MHPVERFALASWAMTVMSDTSINAPLPDDAFAPQPGTSVALPDFSALPLPPDATSLSGQAPSGAGASDDLSTLRPPPPPGASPLAARPPIPGGRPVLMAYEILDVLGRGGMGVVYRAWQRALNRVVALKIARLGEHQEEELARFRTEAEAVARLQHPNIVQIYEVGEHDGYPFLALEYVDGGSLAQQLDGTPWPARKAGTLLETLARVIHSAHRCGIVHRDLKPANILMTVEGTPKITDFGLAKLLVGGSEDQTETGAVLGTPGYMAPEQAGVKPGNLGPAADIYALGSILYDLLTGRPPFRSTTPLETLMQVRHQEPVPVRRLQPSVPRDLETICLKCLLKEPNKRYGSALALAEDLQRFLANEPIVARPVGICERTLKWAKRRPALAGLVAVSVVAVLGLLVGGWWTVATVTTAKNREEAQRIQADNNFRDALRAVEKMLAEVGAVELADVPHMEAVRKKLLLEAQQFFIKFLNERGDDPAVRPLAARAYLHLADVQEMLGEHVEAEATYGKSITLLEDDDQQSLAQCRHQLGVLLKKNSRVQEAERELRQALELRRELAEVHADDPAFRRDLEATRYLLAAVLVRQGERDREAESTYREVLTAQEKLVGEFRDRPEWADYAREVARTCNNLGILLEVAADRKEAEERFLQARGLLEQLTSQFPSVASYQWQLARSCNNLARVRREESAGELDYREAERRLANLAAEYPRVPDYRQELAAVHSNLGRLLTRMSRDAEPSLQKARTLRQQLVNDYPNVPDYRYTLARVHLNLGVLLAKARPKEAEQAYRAALDLQEQLVGTLPNVADYRSTLGTTLNQLARLLAARNDPAALQEARRMLDRAIDNQQAALKANPRNRLYRDYLGKDRAALASVLLRLGKHAEAAEQAEELSRLLPEEVEYLRAAQFLAQCVSQSRKDTTLDDTQRQEHARNYTSRAAAILRTAIEKGVLKDARKLQSPFLAPLREDAEFQKLIRELEKKASAVGRAGGEVREGPRGEKNFSRVAIDASSLAF